MAKTLNEIRTTFLDYFEKNDHRIVESSNLVPNNDPTLMFASLESIFKNGYRYQKAGVMLTGLSNADGKKNLFSSEKDEKINSLMRSMDNTNYRYGRATLSLASAGVHKKWNMRRQYSSKIDTADFYCLPTIRA